MPTFTPNSDLANTVHQMQRDSYCYLVLPIEAHFVACEHCHVVEAHGDDHAVCLAADHRIIRSGIISGLDGILTPGWCPLKEHVEKDQP